MMSSSDSDDDLFPGLNSKPKATNASSTGASTPTGATRSGVATPSSTAGGDGNYASNLLAARRRGLQSRTSLSGNPSGRASPSGAAGAITSPTGATPVAASTSAENSEVSKPPMPAQNTMVFPQDQTGSNNASQIASAAAPQPAAKSNVPPLHPTSTGSQQPAAAAAAPSPVQSSLKQSPQHSAASQSPKEEHKTPPKKEPSPSAKPVLDQARIDELKAKLQAKKDSLAALKEREKKLLQEQKSNAQQHQDKMQQLEVQVRRLWQEAEEQRADTTDEVNRAEEAKEQFLREERQKVEQQASAEAAPKIAELQKELQELQSTRDKLQHGLSSASSNKNLVDTAVAAALSKVLGGIQDHFKEKLEKDPEWEESVAAAIQAEIKSSFAASVSGEADSERQEQNRAFEETLEMWRDAEDEERLQIARMDEQLLLDLQSMAHDDMDRLQREEMSMQEVYMATRESWAQHHRNNLNAELEASLQRRAIEFEDQRAQRQQLSVLRVKLAEEQHEKNLGKLKEFNEKSMDSLRQLHAQKQLINDERAKMMVEAREEAAKATRVLTEVVSSVSKTLDRLDNYKTAVDESRNAVEAERQRQLCDREQTLSEVQNMVVAQATAVENERRALSGALVKLDVVHGSINKQLEDERAWIGRNVSTLERSRADWEREYRRWQHVAQQEKLDAEQRFSNILMDLRQAASALEDEGRELDIEANALRRHCSDRSNRCADEVAELKRKEDELNERYNAMVAMVQEVEKRSQQLSLEWQQLHTDRQNLAVDRQDLQQEEHKLQVLSDNLKAMRGNVENAHVESAMLNERAKAMRHGIATSREVVNTDLKGLQEQSDRLARQRERLGREQARLNEMALGQYQDPNSRPAAGGAKAQQPGRQHQDPSRLPNRVMAELQEILNRTGATNATQHQQSGYSQHHSSPSPQGSSRPQAAPSAAAQEEGEEERSATMPDQTATSVNITRGTAHTGGGASAGPSFQFTNFVQLSDTEGSIQSGGHHE